jgi:hypothetical protein
MVLEGGTRQTFDRLTQQLHWPPGPAVPVKPSGVSVQQTMLPHRSEIAQAAVR